jgi:hypothetical protein
MSAIYKKPLVGLLGLFVGFMTQPLGHTVYTLIEKGAGNFYPVVAVITGVIGLAIVWSGLKRDEHTATFRGLLGGWLLWIGWFEFSFKFFAELYNVPPYPVEANGYAAAPQANLLQATLPLMAALFIVYGLFNLQTKCNFMRWFHRNLRFSPGMPTPDNHRSFARITAMEVLFVTWFCYLFWLYMIYFGTKGPGMNIIMGVYAAWTAWSVYLVYKCTQQVRVAPAMRYGVGAGIVLWAVAEMPAHFGAYKELWLKPFEYPIFNLISASLFIGGLVILARWKKPAQQSMAAEVA